MHALTNGNKTFRLSPDRIGLWMLTALVLKIIYVTVFYHAIDFGYRAMGWTQAGMLGYVSGDTPGYWDPIEHWFTQGSYSPDYRMPGYGAIYLVIRLFVSKSMAMDVIVFVQLLTAALSVWCLARAVYKFTKDKILFYCVFFIYTLSMRSSFWDFGYVTESFTTSFLIFSVYFFARFYETQKSLECLWSGIFLTWAIFLRPVYLPVYLVLVFIVCLLAIRQWKSERGKILKWAFLLCLPFLIVDGVWIIRNYSKYRSVLPLTKSFYATDFENSYLSSLMNFVIAAGGDRSYWNPHGEIRWYLPDLSYLPSNLAEEPPSSIYTSAFNRDSLDAIKSDIAVIEDSSTSKEVSTIVNTSVKNRLERFTISIRKEKPFLFYFKSRVIFLKRFLVHSGTDFLPPLRFPDMTIAQQFLKLSNTASYLIAVLFGIAGCIFIVLTFRMELFVFALTGVFSIAIYPLLGQLEPRYFVPAFPFVLVCGVYFLTVIIHKMNTLLRKS